MTGLRPFEQQLLDGIAAPGSSVRVSELASRVQESIGGVQNALYDEMVSNGWFERRPDDTRNRWTQLALAALIISVVVTGVLAAFTTFGLVGLALIAVSLGPGFRRAGDARPDAQGSCPARRPRRAALGSDESPDQPAAARQ